MELVWLDLALLFILFGIGMTGFYAGAIKFAGPSAFIFTMIALFYIYPNISSRFESDLPSQFFLYLLLGFVALVIYAFITRAVHGAVQTNGIGVFNRLLGVGLGLITGALIAGTLVWAYQTYGNSESKALIEDSIMATAVVTFFHEVMGFFQRLLPESEIPEQEDVPWWRRPLW